MREEIKELVTEIIHRNVSVPCGLELPSTVFFQPSMKFIEWANEQDTTFIDCGAGMGQLAGVLDNVKCIDINTREYADERVIPFNSVLYPFESNNSALFCRPNHNIWIKDTAIMALVRGAKVYYVGFEKNLENDLPDFEYNLILEFIGWEGENLWQITKNL